MCICATECVPDTFEDQERALNPAGVRDSCGFHVGGGNRTLILFKDSKCS